MGLRCLLGHDFDQPQVERERDVDGDEVVVTVREVKTCRRCGERQVVSESKEVTTLEEYHLGPDAVAGREGSAVDAATTNEDSADGAVDDAGDRPASDAGRSPAEADAPGEHDGPGGVAETDPAAAETDPPTADAPGDPGDTGGSTHVETADAVDDTVEAIGAVRDADAVADEPVGGDDGDVDGDDGIILDADDGADADERRRGEWPDAPDVDFDAGPAPDGADGADGTAPTADAPSTDDADGEAVADADADAALDADADGAADPDADADAAPGDVSDDEGATDVGAGAADGEDAVPEDDAEFIDAGPADDDAEPETDVVAWPAHDSDPAARAAGATDGGGATGDGESTGGAATSGWPEPEGDDEGFDAAPADGDRPAVSFGGGLTPDAVDDAGEYVGHERETAADAEFVSAPDAGASDAPARRIEFYCPNCGHAESAGATSMRAGDICPDCRKGYIAERTT